MGVLKKLRKKVASAVKKAPLAKPILNTVAKAPLAKPILSAVGLAPRSKTGMTASPAQESEVQPTPVAATTTGSPRRGSSLVRGFVRKKLGNPENQTVGNATSFQPGKANMYGQAQDSAGESLGGTEQDPALAATQEELKKKKLLLAQRAAANMPRTVLG